MAMLLKSVYDDGREIFEECEWVSYLIEPPRFFFSNGSTTYPAPDCNYYVLNSNGKTVSAKRGAHCQP